MRGMGRAGGRGLKDGRRPDFRTRVAVAGMARGTVGADGAPWGLGADCGGGGGVRRPLELRREDGGGEPAPGRYLSWVFIILGGSAQGGRRRRGEWVGGRVGGCGVARAGRSLWAKSLSGRGPSALLLPQRAPASN